MLPLLNLDFGRSFVSALGGRMIPDFGLGNVLPPFMDEDATGLAQPRSPYRATMSEFVRRFATSPERAQILRGLKGLRDTLRGLGFDQGFQWINGSFVEACEIVKGRPPEDVDVVSVIRRPAAHVDEADWGAFVAQHLDTTFDAQHCKQTYLCDAYFVDLDVDPLLTPEQIAYWFGLFSHQRDTFRWKGLVQVSIQCDDDAAMEALDEIEAAGW